MLFFFGAIVALAASAGRVKSSRSRHAAVRRPATARVVALPSAGHRVRVEFSQRCLCTLYALIGFEYEEMDDGADESWSRSLFHQTVISYLHSGLVIIEAIKGSPAGHKRITRRSRRPQPTEYRVRLVGLYWRMYFMYLLVYIIHIFSILYKF